MRVAMLHFIVLLLSALVSSGVPARELAAEQRIPDIAAAALPVEARETLALIKRRGPFPYRKDGVYFQNRERRLPMQISGHYREYTVPTPGAHDRGPRRIIAGASGAFYYTDDHYRSFRRIRE